VVRSVKTEVHPPFHKKVAGRSDLPAAETLVSQPWSLQFGAINLGNQPAVAREIGPETPFRILLLGDFSGRDRRGGPAASWKPIVIDRDNFDDVMGKLGVEVRTTMPGQSEPVVLRFAELDDFHPDRLYQQVPVFEELRDLRRRLKNPAALAKAAAELRAWAHLPAAPAPAPAAEPLQPGPGGGDLLDQVLGRTGAESSPETNPLQEYLRKLVQPHAIPRAGDESALVEVVDEVAAARMRALLHDPAFQAVESAWRALGMLVRRLDTDGNLKLFLVDVSRDELTADLSAADLSRSQAYRVLVEGPLGTPGGTPWAVLVGNYTLAPTMADGILAARLAHLAEHAGAPFLAGAHASFLGCASLAETPDPDDWKKPLDPQATEVWQALRLLPPAQFLGLALPRFLVRQPYGKDGGTTEDFVFEEIGKDSGHEDFLWANSAFACALVLGKAYERRGWELTPGAVEAIDGLPTWIQEVDGERGLLPCAEVLLRDRAARAIVTRGLTPVRSVQNREAIQIGPLASLAEPARPLAGRWRR